MIEEVQIALAFMFYFLRGQWNEIIIATISIIELIYIFRRYYENNYRN